LSLIFRDIFFPCAPFTHSPASLQLGYDPPSLPSKETEETLWRCCAALLLQNVAAMHTHQTRFLIPCGSIFTSASFPQDDPRPQTLSLHSSLSFITP
jgi:hypothetical protein